MVWIQSPNLTLTTVGSNVTIRVQYRATVNDLERHMCANGMVFYERIQVFGIDPPGAYAGTVIANFPTLQFPISPNPIARDRSITVPRANLQEDSGVGDMDEIRCKIIIYPVNLPAESTGWTDQEVLLG